MVLISANVDVFGVVDLMIVHCFIGAKEGEREREIRTIPQLFSNPSIQNPIPNPNPAPSRDQF